MLCATVEDKPRFRDLIGQWIAEGSVPEFPAFVGESEKKRQSLKRRYQEEAKEAEEALRLMRADTSEGEERVKEYVGEGVVDCLVQRIKGGVWTEHNTLPPVCKHPCKCIAILSIQWNPT